MYSLLCKPVVYPYNLMVTTKLCRVVVLTPAPNESKNKYTIEILEAPPVNVVPPPTEHE
jgi:hypothetical protein